MDIRFPLNELVRNLTGTSLANTPVRADIVSYNSAMDELDILPGRAKLAVRKNPPSIVSGLSVSTALQFLYDGRTGALVGVRYVSFARMIIARRKGQLPERCPATLASDMADEYAKLTTLKNARAEIMRTHAVGRGFAFRAGLIPPEVRAEIASAISALQKE